MNLESKLESILFYKNEPLSIRKLCELTNEKENKIRETLESLSKNLEGRGICLIQTDTEVSLATAPEMKEIIEQIAKEEMRENIGKAGLETLAIVLYNGPVSRREIDYIRGVNSTFILRSLAVRGLIERENDSQDQRIIKYKTSLNLLAHLGIKKVQELPEFENLQNQIKETQVSTKI